MNANEALATSTPVANPTTTAPTLPSLAEQATVCPVAVIVSEGLEDGRLWSRARKSTSARLRGMSLLPGVARLEAELKAQDAATQAHRQWEGEALRDLRAETGEIKALATATNGRVNAHDIEIAVMRKAEEQALVIDAARTKAAEAARASRISLRQGLVIAAFTVGAGCVLTVMVALVFGLAIS